MSQQLRAGKSTSLLRRRPSSGLSAFNRPHTAAPGEGRFVKFKRGQSASISIETKSNLQHRFRKGSRLLISNKSTTRRYVTPAADNRNKLKNNTADVNRILPPLRLQSKQNMDVNIKALKFNRPGTAPVTKSNCKMKAYQRLHTHLSMSRNEKHQLMQNREKERENRRAEVYAMNKVLREAFEADFAAFMERMHAGRDNAE